MKRMASLIITLLSSLVCSWVLVSTGDWYMAVACFALMLLNFADGYWRLGVKEQGK